ncbi:MAG: hydrolase [Verrucomicrobia bacterium]|nr:hydrolase [Verrucomicrobiota bacterium]
MALPSPVARLPERSAEFGALLVKWAEINSGSGHVAGLDRMRAALREEFGRIPGATVEELPCAGTAAALRVSLRPEAKVRVLLSGHFDTVFEADDPFQRCQWLDAERLNGPGVADMKGGLLTMLAALQAFEQTPHAANIGWDALLNPDEETGSHGSAHLFREAPRRAQFALVFEPARPNGDVVHSRKGTGSLVATCRGRAAHAAKIPNDGRNAILGLSDFLLVASKVPAEMSGVLVNVGNIRGGGPATNVVPDFATAELDLRVTREAERAPLLARFDALAAEVSARHGVTLELRGGFNRPPKECLPLEEKVFAAWQRAAADVGVPRFSWVHTGGASDGNLLTAAGLPNLDGLGPIGDQLHSAREFVVVSTIAQRAQLAALFLHRLAAGEISLG